MNRDYLGFAVSMALLIGGYFYINSYYMKKADSGVEVSQPAATAVAPTVAQTQAAPAEMVSAPPQVLTPVPAATPIAEAKPEDLILDSGFVKARFAQAGGCLVSLELSKFKASLKGSDLVELFPNHQLCKAFGFKVGGVDIRDQKAAVERISPTQIRITQVASDLEIQRTFTFKKDLYDGELAIAIRNLAAKETKMRFGFELGAHSESKEAGGMFGGTPLQNMGFSYRDSEKVHRIPFPFEKEPKPGVLLEATDVSAEWIASGTMYFFWALLPDGKSKPSLTVLRNGTLIAKDAQSEPDQTVYEAWVEHPLKLAANETKQFNYKFYVGPKSKRELDKFSDRKLNEAVDFGFFSVIAWPLFYTLRFIEGIFGNWGIAIIILTAIVKLLLYPLALKSYISMKKMQKVQPEIKALQEKYKNDKQKLNQEMMALMSQKGANPLGGCLPILPQIPIFFGLFSVFQQTFELRHAPFALWIRDLSVMDQYFVLPILIAALYYGQQKITPPAPGMDPVQQKMMQFLPFVFAIMMVTFPSGLSLYIVTNTVLTILQQIYMMRKYKEV